jgi:hypothetical protein
MLAAPPDRLTAEPVARMAADRFVANRFGSSAGSLARPSAALLWVASNDTWDAIRPDAPGATARLAWVVTYRSAGALADRLTAIEVRLDAGSLDVIGGDVAE